jgi:hypothetical protein
MYDWFDKIRFHSHYRNLVLTLVEGNAQRIFLTPSLTLGDRLQNAYIHLFTAEMYISIGEAEQGSDNLQLV